MPGQSGLNRLVSLVSSYAGIEFDWDIKLILKHRSIKPLKLGEFGALGLMSWAGIDDNAGDFNALVINPRQLLTGGSEERQAS